MKTVITILLSMLMFASFLASNNMLPILKKQNDYIEVSKDAEFEKDAEKEGKKENPKKNWLTTLNSSQTQTNNSSSKDLFANYISNLLFVVNDIEVRPPRC